MTGKLLCRGAAVDVLQTFDIHKRASRRTVRRKARFISWVLVCDRVLLHILLR